MISYKSYRDRCVYELHINIITFHHVACKLTNKPVHLPTAASECRFSSHGAEYMGYKNKTISGRTCQRWDAQTPHAHNMANYPLAWTLEENYCRNADGELEPWCYTTDVEKRWELCVVPLCNGTCDTNISLGII